MANNKNHNQLRLKLTRGAPASVTIGFRLEEEAVCALMERAARLKISPHELAREYVLEALSEEEERRALRDAIGALHERLASLREDLALVGEALLVSAGKADMKEARDWAERNFESG